MSHTFAGLGVSDELCAQLARQGIVEPFPIQAATLPDALAGRDICGQAPTGSGKTIAFGLTIATRARRGAARRPTTLVLVPTRELASQVAREIETLSRGRGLRVATVYGGTGYGPQRQALRAGASILVACPGRLEDLVQQGDVSLADVDLVVLDEADRMADMGFLPAVRRLVDQTATPRQTLLFSATLDKEIEVLVRRYQDRPRRHHVLVDDGDPGDVAHAFWRVARGDRVHVAAGLVQRHGRVIVFCRTRRGADRLTTQLRRVGVSAQAVHGSRSQNQRERALSAFSRGRVDALVATDVAARGIHVADVGCVLHFDLPAEPKDYVHRSGRTGRAGADGTVVSLVLDEQRREARVLQRALDLPEELAAPDLPVASVSGHVPPDVPTEAPPNGRAAARESDRPTGNRRRRPRRLGDGRGPRPARRGGSAGGAARGGQARGARRPRAASRS